LVLENSNNLVWLLKSEIISTATFILFDGQNPEINCKRLKIRSDYLRELEPEINVAARKFI
jgi:hypothetical protein